jgi:hypothetical protein
MATGITYTPLVGNNIIDSFINLEIAPANAIAKTAGQGDGRPGHMKCLMTLQSTDVSDVDNLTLLLLVKSPLAFPRDALGVVVLPAVDQAAYAPACSISLKSQVVDEDLRPRISVGNALVDGFVPITISFDAGAGATAAEFHVSVDFSHTAMN